MTGRLTHGQTLVLAAATLPMVGAGIAGGLGTYTNIATEFGRAETALGVVAAGEGVTLVLALVMVGLTMLGQSAPTPVRAGLWLAPVAAALTGVVVADTVTEAVVYAMTPMAMSASAEGMGLLARRIVVHRTGLDMEAQRRNAETVQRLAYHRARAANHPSEKARKRSERTSWRLARRVGVGDAELGTHLVQVQRERLREGADAALGDMLAVTPTNLAIGVETAASPAEVTVDRADTTPAEAVMPPVAALPPAPFRWGDMEGPEATAHRAAEMTGKATATLAAERPRQVVTAPVTERTTEAPEEMTAAELRRAARRLNREAIRSTGRPVTINRLRTELGLSRRQATELRRRIVPGGGAETPHAAG